LTIGTLVGKYWKCYNTPTDYGRIDWDETWEVASNQHLYRKTVSLVVTANRTVNVLVLWGEEIKNIHNFDETWMTLCHYTTKIKSGRKTANINTKQPQKFYHC